MRNALLEEGPYEVLFFDLQECCATKSVGQNCQTKLSYKVGLQEYPRRVSPQNVRQKYQTRFGRLRFRMCVNSRLVGYILLCSSKLGTLPNVM